MKQPLDSAAWNRLGPRPWVAVLLVLSGCGDPTAIQPGDIRTYSVPKPIAEPAPASGQPPGEPDADDPAPEAAN